MKKVLHGVGLLAGMVALAYFVRHFINSYQQIADRIEFSWFFIGCFAAATTVWLVNLPITAWVWKDVVADLGGRLPSRKALTILGLSQFGKYLPGNVGQHVGRIVMSAQAGIKGEVLGLSMLVEAAFLACTGAAIALLTLPPAHARMNDMAASVNGIPLMGGTVALAVALLSWPRLRTRLMGFVNKIVGIPPARYVWLLATFTICYAQIAVALWLLFFGLGVKADWVLLFGVGAGSWLVGFLVPGAPAGMGVREMAALVLMDGRYPEEIALLAIIGLRLVSIISDIFWFIYSGLAYRNSLSEVDRGGSVA